MAIRVIGEYLRGLGSTRWFQGMFRWQRLRNSAKCAVAFIVLPFVFFIFFNGSAALWGKDLRFIEKLPIAEEKDKVPLKFVSFCVIEGEHYLIPDLEAGDIKIYEKNGTSLKWIGKIENGYNSTKLVKPTYCSYDSDASKFAVLDHSSREIFIYDRMGLTDFKCVGEVSCISGGSDIQLSNNKLYIAGYNSDRNIHYYLYNIDISDGKTTFLLPAYTMFGYQSNPEFTKGIKENPDIAAIGINFWFDIYGNDAFSIWEGNLSVIKVNVESGAVNPGFFSDQSSTYIKPHATDKLVAAQRKRDNLTIRSEREKMSYVRNLFVSEKSKLLLVIYEGPVDENNELLSRLQLYTLDGDFIKETPIRLAPDSKIWFDKEKDILYALSGESKAILKYRLY